MRGAGLRRKPRQAAECVEQGDAWPDRSTPAVVLAVDFTMPAPDGAQRLDAHRLVVDEGACARPPSARAAGSGPRRPRSPAFRGQTRGMVGGQVEHGRHLTLRLPGTHEGCRRARRAPARMHREGWTCQAGFSPVSTVRPRSTEIDPVDQTMSRMASWTSIGRAMPSRISRRILKSLGNPGSRMLVRLEIAGLQEAVGVLCTTANPDNCARARLPRFAPRA